MVTLTLTLALGLGAVASAAMAYGQQLLAITVLGNSGDPRSAALQEAVSFWNAQLERTGAQVRFGPVTFRTESLADETLRAISRQALVGQRSAGVSDLIESVAGDVVIAMSGADLTSCGFAFGPGGTGFLVVRRGDIEPLSLPNVARNVVAHELRHVLGLAHASDPRALMCGRPAPCRPSTFAAETPHFFPLSPPDDAQLRNNWP